MGRCKGRQGWEVGQIYPEVCSAKHLKIEIILISFIDLVEG